MLLSSLFLMACSVRFLMQTSITSPGVVPPPVRNTYPNKSSIKKMNYRLVYRKILFVSSWYNTNQNNRLIINLSHTLILINYQICLKILCNLIIWFLQSLKYSLIFHSLLEVNSKNKITKIKSYFIFPDYSIISIIF